LAMCALLWSFQAWAGQPLPCNAAHACNDTTVSCPASPTQTARACRYAQQLVHQNALPLLTLNQLNRKALIQQASAALEKQALEQLDPGKQLADSQLQSLKAMIAADIHPLLEQAVHSLNQPSLASSLSNSYLSTLTESEMVTLLDFYRSSNGRRYLAFNKDLDGILLQGLAQISRQPFSFSRSEQGNLAMRQQRQSLLAMSLPVRLLQGTKHTVNNAQSLAMDLLAVQSGPQLDSLGKRYARDLADFRAFQNTPAALSEIRAQSRWNENNRALLATVSEQARLRLPGMLTRWQQKAQGLRAKPASSAQ